MRSAGLRVLAAGRDGNSRASHSGAVRRARRGGGAETPRVDPFLSTGRTGRHRRAGGRAILGTSVAGVRRVVHRDRGRVMLVVMQNHATQEQVDRVVKTIEEMGYAARPMPGEQR